MAPVDAIFCFSEDVAFPYHFMATRPLPILPPCRRASDIGYTSKNLTKMADNSASFTLNSCGKDRS